jgi:hypothetical protein
MQLPCLADVLGTVYLAPGTVIAISCGVFRLANQVINGSLDHVTLATFKRAFPFSIIAVV